ncbi:uncharacterized protein [Physcomitrium patens]|uniref:uncharacterized protein n=1 Tax=Physcomitrium patens TaxID=3218 RepID=UPI000D171AF9|nr:uncharacterized protein LOC112278692 [Physcomitrium patens]XP_024368095.1 uncharacterized protein LOC112278692 [Physcomitrium patens]|eukprot:XP_024368094.1 uncharacterized protein LOC112278692 [Physcomitrella patens]
MEVRIGIALREHTLFLGSLFSGMRSSLKLVDGVVTNKPSAHYTSICVTSLVDGGVGDRRRTTGAVPQQSLCVVLEAVWPHIHQWVALKTNNDPLSMLNAGRPSSMILS